MTFITSQVANCGVTPMQIVVGDFGTPLTSLRKDSEVNILCTTADPQERVRVVHQFLQNNTTGLPDNVVAFNLTTNAPFPIANLAQLVKCGSVDKESDPIAWCANGENYSQFTVKVNGAPTGEVYWLNDMTGSVSATKPVGAIKGVCLAFGASARTVKGDILVASGNSINMAAILAIFPAGSVITSIDADALTDAFLRVDGVNTGIEASNWNWNRSVDTPLFGNITINALGGDVAVEIQAITP